MEEEKGEVKYGLGSAPALTSFPRFQLGAINSNKRGSEG